VGIIEEVVGKIIHSFVSKIAVSVCEGLAI